MEKLRALSINQIEKYIVQEKRQIRRQDKKGIRNIRGKTQSMTKQNPNREI